MGARRPQSLANVFLLFSVLSCSVSAFSLSTLASHSVSRGVLSAMATARGHGCSEFVAKPVRLAGGFKDLVEDYDGFILDQYGVMHNGAAALPGAVECFNQLAEAGKKIVVLSNTSQRATKAMSKLPSLGFDISKIAGLVCSGCVAPFNVKEWGPSLGSVPLSLLWCLRPGKKRGATSQSDTQKEEGVLFSHGSAK